MKNRKRYQVAISFAGEDRKCADALAEALKCRNVTFFYDKYEKADLWGKNLYTHLSEVYKNQADYCIMLISQHYAEKAWTNHEREAAQARAFQEHEEYILPVRLDDTEIPGILPTVGYLKWPPEDAESIADAILAKLNKVSYDQRSDGQSNEIYSQKSSRQKTVAGQWIYPIWNDTIYLKQSRNKVVGFNDSGTGFEKVSIFLGTVENGLFVFKWKTLNGKFSGYGKLMLSNDGQLLSGKYWHGTNESDAWYLQYRRVSDNMPSWLNEDDFAGYSDFFASD